ncbi:MAG: GNAT family N-acetyltransferase [Chloroflexota bacterium]
MAALTLRHSRPEDATAMAQLASRAYERYVSRIEREPAPMSADYNLIAGAQNTWVAESNGRIVGLLVLEARRDHLLLENLAVAPEAQGIGIGARLLRVAEEVARERRLPEVRLYTNAAMTENLNYYVRHGYRETHRGTHDGYRRVFFTKVVADDPPDFAR